MKLVRLITLAALFFLYNANNTQAQLSSVDTACLGVPVAFSTTNNSVYNTWVMDTVNLNQTPVISAAVSMAGSGLSTPTFSKFIKDNGVWYAFVTNYHTRELRRLTFTGNPLSSSYTSSLVGVYGTSQLEGVDIVRDSATGNWYGFVVTNDRLYSLSFGSSLANAPASSMYSTSLMFWAHQFGVAKYGNQWIGFIADRNSTILRVDFGTSITNTPTFTRINNVGSVVNPCGFAIHNENGNWYMLVTSLINGTITRYNFGTNIQNNTPTGTLLGNPGSYLSIPRSVGIIADCNQLYAYVCNENGLLTKWDFNNSITNAPTVTSLGNTNTGTSNGFSPFVSDSALNYGIFSQSNGNFYKIRMVQLPPYNVTNFYNPAASYTFTTSGIKNISLFKNMGEFMGGSAFCKNLFIGPVGSKKDTIICGTSHTLNAARPGATGYLWNTGASTPSITVTATGKYWVTVSGVVCPNSDTFNVTIQPVPQLSLGNDTAICGNDSVRLKNIYTNLAGATYLWSNASVDSAIFAKASGKYWLTVTKNTCAASDTINLAVTPVPLVDLGNDTTICAEDVIRLQNKTGLPFYTNLWSTGSTASYLDVSSGGRYWLRASLNGCVAYDTIDITVLQLPLVNLGPDTLICEGGSITLRNKFTSQTGTHLWSTGSTDNNINASAAGIYWLQVSAGSCKARDTITLDTKANPIVFAGNDTAICAKDTITLRSNSQPAGSLYNWSTGSKQSTTKTNGKGFYTLAVTYNGCTSVDSINVAELSLPYIELGPARDLCKGTTLKLPEYIEKPAGTKMLWSGGSTDSTYTVSQPGVVTVQIENVCGIVHDAVNITFRNCKIWFPSAFSPNADGSNDLLKLLGDIANVKDYELSVYNRWGQKIFTTTDVTTGWNGMHKGQPADFGVYYYMCTLEYLGAKELLKGDITLVR